jgi:hypothetical protein
LVLLSTPMLTLHSPRPPCNVSDRPNV